MSSPINPGDAKIVCVRHYGGEVPPSSVLAPKLGPLGISPKKVGEDVQKETLEWKGVRVTTQISILNRQATISIRHSASSLILKALKEPIRDRKKVKNITHCGNITMEALLQIAKQMHPRSMSKEFAGTVKQILGTASSIGCTIGGKTPRELQTMIDTGELCIPEVSSV